MVFFSQFLATAGLFADYVRTCPLRFTSPNAPAVHDLLGTITLAILAGQNRYAHVTALRVDTVNPQGLGMTSVCSEDSVRRAFAGAEAAACELWQTMALEKSWRPALRQPWIMDLDATVKPIYGRQEGAQIGYNPHKPGRPSHAYHTLFVRGLRLVLDVEVRPGKQHAAPPRRENLWRVWDRLPQASRPWLICGDASYGHEGLLAECETRGQKYLFRLRQSPGVKQLVQTLERQSGWQEVGHGYSAAEGRLQLTGWSAKRRVLVLRRKKEYPKPEPPADHALPWSGLMLCQAPVAYEYQVLVTNLSEERLTVAGLYRQRADAENVYDELKNQWGWGGFTTKDLLRCQVAARNVALVYNWWSLFVRCAEPAVAREAITSRPLLLCAVGRLVASWTPSDLAADQHPRRSGAGAAVAHGLEFVSERVEEHCGAVGRGRLLGTNLDEDIAPVATESDRAPWPERLKTKPPQPHPPKKPAPRPFSNARLSGASSNCRI